MKNAKTAVFGSAFNPPHRGHADVVNQALNAFSAVVLVPSYAHAFGKTMAPYPVRMELTKTFVALHDWGERVQVSDIEARLAAAKGAGEPIFTYDVLCALETEIPGGITFVVGPDNANPETWSRFYKSREIDERWGHWEAEERIHVRSTAIREALKAGAIPADDACPAAIWKIYQQFID